MRIKHLKLFLRWKWRRFTHSHTFNMYRKRSRIWSSRLAHGVMTAVVIFSIIPAVLLSGLFQGNVNAATASQGPRYATATTDCVNNTSIGTIAWNTPGESFSSNNTYAEATLATTEISNYALCTNFGFSLPSGVTVSGITMILERKAATATRIYDSRISIVKGGAVGTTNRATGTAWPTTEATATYGSTSDLWGETWAIADINATNFGIAIAATKSGGGGAVLANIDSVTLTVQYSFNPTFEQSSYSWLNNQDTTMNQTFIQDYSNTLGASITKVADGSYRAVGNTFGSIAFDQMGNYVSSQQWLPNAGGEMSNTVKIKATSDGGFVIIGGYNPALFDMPSPWDAMIWKYDASGNLSWYNRWGGTTGSRADYANDVVETTDGGFVMSGHTYVYGAGDMDAYIAKYTSTGTLSWSKTWGGVLADQSGGVAATSDGGVLLTGLTANYGAGLKDMFIAKYTSTGTLSWSKTWGGSGFDDNGADIITTSDSGYAVIGTTASYGAGVQDMFIAKYDSSNNLSWSKTWGGTGADYGHTLIQTSDGGYAAKGTTDSYGAGLLDSFVAKYDSTGTLSWSKSLGDSTDNGGSNMIQTTDGGYVFTETAMDYLIKTDSNGAVYGCSSPMCQTVTPSTGSPTASVSAPTPTETSPNGSMSDPAGTASSTSYSTTQVLAPEPIDTSSALNSVAQNTATTALGEQQIFRLRMNLHVGTDPAIPGGGLAFKLQYAPKIGVCDTAFSGENYEDVTTSSLIAYADNTKAIDGVGLITNANDPTHSGHTVVNQEYNELNNTDVVNSIAAGQDGMWDFALKDNGAPATTSYCFRLINSGGSPLNTYTVIPEITTLSPYFDQANYRWYKGQDAVPNNTFVQSWGGAASDRAYDIVQTSDGGYVVTGDTASYGGGGSSDMFIAKYDSTGALSWSRTWGGTNTEQGQAVIQTKDGGYAVTGSGGGAVMMLVKYDASGTISWDRTWGGTGTNIGQDVIQTDDGGYAIAGYTTGYGAGSNDAILVKFDAAGTLSWSRTWGDTGSDLATSLVQTQDQGYVITGTTGLGAGAGDMFIAKFDTLGSLSWNKTWGGVGFESGSSIIQANDGGFAVAGNTASYGVAGAEMFLAKYDSLGSLSWSRAWGGSGDEYVNDVVQGIDGGYTVAGDTTSFGAGLGDVFLTKFNSAGTLSWDKTWGTSVTEQSSALTSTSDGGYAAVARGVVTGGGGSNDSIVFKYDANGDIYGCITPMCQDPAATVNTPSVTPGTPSVTPGTPGATVNDPAITPTSPAPTVTAIAGHMTFVKTWGGAQDDRGFSIAGSSDGGFALAGYTGSYGAGNFDSLLTKYDSTGNLLWSRTWGGTTTDNSNGMVKTSDGGYAVMGVTGTGYDMFLLKYDSSGNLSWNSTWNQNADTGRAIVQTSDGGYAITGETDVNGASGINDMFLTKLNSSGSVSWSRIWGDSGNTVQHYGLAIVQTSDGGYAITGRTDSWSAGVADVFLVKYDSTGNLLWSRTWGGTGNEAGRAIVQTADGGFIITGDTASFGTAGDMFIIKYNSTGTIVWERNWGGAAADAGYGIAHTNDGNYVITGQTASYGAGGVDAALVKYDDNGNLLWSRTWGTANDDNGRAIIQTLDNGFAMAGYSGVNIDMFIAKFNNNGNIIGCGNPTCQSPTVANGTPIGTKSSPTPTVSSPSVTAGTGVATSPSATPSTNTYQVNKQIWGETVPLPATPIGAQDTAGGNLRHDDPLRLRFTLQSKAGGKSAVINGANLKLQVAPRVGTCDATFTGESYADLSSFTAFNYYDNTNLTTGTWARTGPFDPTVGAGILWYENYQEAAGFTNRHHISIGNSGLWDISLTPTDDALYNSYCFRVVNNDNSLLNTYTRAFEVSIPPAASQQMRHGKFFDTTGTKQPFYW